MCACVCGGPHMCIHTRGQCWLPSFFLKQGLLLTLELTGSERLAGCWASEIVQSLPSSSRVIDAHHQGWLSSVFWGSELYILLEWFEWECLPYAQGLCAQITSTTCGGHGNLKKLSLVEEVQHWGWLVSLQLCIASSLLFLHLVTFQDVGSQCPVLDTMPTYCHVSPPIWALMSLEL